MPEVEKAFTDALQRAAGLAPVEPALDAAELAARGRGRGSGHRWLAAAAAVVLLTGAGVAVAMLNRGSSVAAVPAGPSTAAAADLALAGTDWKLAELAGREWEPSASLGQPSISFDFDGRFTASDGCNTLAGPVRSNGDHLRFGDWTSTLMYCEGDSTAFSNALQATVAARIDGDRLRFLDSGGSVVAGFTVAASPVTDVRALTGRVWEAVVLLGKEVPRQPSGTQPWLTFGEDSRLTSFDGCHTTTRNYSLTDGVLTLGEPDSMAVCDYTEGVSDSSVPFADALERAHLAQRGLTPEGLPELVLSNRDGKPVATLVARVGDDPVAGAPGSTTATVEPAPGTSSPGGTPEPGLGSTQPTTTEPTQTEPTTSAPATSVPAVTPPAGPGPTLIDETRRRADAPDQVSDQMGRTVCGEQLLGQQELLSAEVLDCFTTRLGTEGVELAFTVPTVEGDPIVYFVIGDAGSDRIGIWESSHWDSFGADAWTHRTCPGSAAGSLHRLLTCGT